MMPSFPRSIAVLPFVVGKHAEPQAPSVRLVAGVHNLFQHSPTTLQRSQGSLDCLCAAAHCRSQFVFGCWSRRQQAFQSPQLVHHGMDYYGA
jgi:hypothetical protein